MMMIERTLGKSGLRAGVVGLGCEHLQGKPLSEIQSVLTEALEGGVNLLDVFMSEPEVRTNIGVALKGRREKVLLQGHIGAGWLEGQYCRTRDPKQYRFFFEDFMTRLQTDYVDIGMLHFVDTQADYKAVLESGMLQYALELKEKGLVRAVGVSSHDPLTAKKIVETGQVDVLMFSINAAYDILPPDVEIDALFKPETYQRQAAFTIAPERQALYQTCERMGVGITVMKALGGGALLGAKTSPFGVALSVAQCMQYALTRPAVTSVLIGCRTAGEVRQALSYLEASDEERDYSLLLSSAPKFSLTGRCMYCNHCLPCPSRIDIAQVNKYLDLAELSEGVPDSVRSHYRNLEATAADCIACGQCEMNCPFGVPVVERMKRAVEVFGG